MHGYCFVASAITVLASAGAVEVPLLETAAWALSSDVSHSCAVQPAFETCKNPWAAAEAWRYATANVLAAALHGAAPRLRAPAEKAASVLTRFFTDPADKAFSRAARRVRLLLQLLLDSGALPRQVFALREEVGLGVPFPISSVLLPREPHAATLQLRSGPAMPLLALATRRSTRPSIYGVAEALRLGIRHVEVPPASAEAVGHAIEASGVSRGDMFLSVSWELPLNSEDRLDKILDELGTDYVNLVHVARGPDVIVSWRLLEHLRAKGKVRALGVRDFRPEELNDLPGGGATVEYAQCVFTPYRPGPSRSTWQKFGRQSVALAASGLLTDWPHVLRPVDDPHVRAVAQRMGRTAAQVLLRWALQLGLAVVFRAAQLEHVAENLDALTFALPDSEMMLLGGLTTLALPSIPPGDGFTPIYTFHGARQQEL